MLDGDESLCTGESLRDLPAITKVHRRRPSVGIARASG